MREPTGKIRNKIARKVSYLIPNRVVYRVLIDTLIADTIKATHQDLLDSGLLEEDTNSYDTDFFKGGKTGNNLKVRAIKDYIDKQQI